MSSVATGDASTVDSYLSRTVTGATNASPIVITTSVAHLFGTDDYVVVSGVGGNTAANGTFQITKLSSTTFSLNGSTGNGAYTSGGAAACITLTPQFTIPGDGDDLDAASVNVALEALADRSQHLALAVKNRQDEFLASGSWTCPDNVFSVAIEGCGGGGGGGNGNAGGTDTDRWPSGGGGGGGAPLVARIVPVTPGTTYTVTIGGGGTAGTDGTSTTFDSLATFSGGGKGGARSTVATIANTLFIIAQAGTVAGVTFPSDTFGPYAEGSTAAIAAAVANAMMTSQAHGAGGASVGAIHASVPSRAGNSSVTGAAGGSAGAHGTDASTRRAGGGGGGGGAGPYGAGANGGAGGNGNGAGAGTNGTAGSSASANTGAGGGGGGAGGHGTTGSPTGGAGGSGGSGRLRIRYVGPQAVTA